MDDDPSVRRALRMQLRLAGFNVRLFSSAEEFLAANLPCSNACLLLDIYLPGITGIDLCEHLVAAGREMSTVLMSGRDDDETKRLARKIKRAPCLFKPFDQSALLRAIGKALYRH
ncbi:MAG: response regulator [Deltaproteobacteria bacterium]|nr:response regulator [Deltaproteobacteria bacterium]